VLAEAVDCSGFLTSIADDMLDHEFGHVFQLEHVATGNVPLIGIWPDIFTDVGNLVVPATNLICGPVSQEDRKILGYLGICSISRQFKFLMDFQQNRALKTSRLLANGVN